MADSTSSLLNITKGELVNYNGQEYVILKVIELTKVLAQSIVTKNTEVLEISHLTPWIIKQEEKTKNQDLDLTVIPEEEWQYARERLKIIQPILSGKVRGTAATKEIAINSGYGIATIYRWVRTFKNSGLLSDLLSEKPGWRSGKWRLNDEVEAIIKERIENFYMTDQKRSIASTIESINRLCKNAGLPKPHWETVNRRIKAIAERERFEKRYSKRAAKQIFDPNEGTIPNAGWPLALVQIDHTPLPVMIVHDKSRRSIGRPYVTFCIDVYSRMITGMELTLEAPSALSAGLCISHSILPKEKWISEEVGLTNVEWPCWGVPGILHMDNAREFRGLTLRDGCLEYNIDPQFRPVKTPHYGGHIERLMGTASEKLKTLEGATFSNPTERGDYDSEERATMTLDDLQQWLVLMIAKYHHSPHSGINGEAPIDRYRSGLLGGDGKLPRGLPARRLDEEKVRLDFIPVIERTIQSYGVLLDHVHYFADVLRPWINTPDPERPKSTRLFKFRRDPHDISRLYFFDPISKRYYVIPYRDVGLPPISLWEYRNAYKAAKKAGVKDVNERVIIEYANKEQEIQDQAGLKTRAARREDQRKINHEKARKKREKDLPKVMKTAAPAIPPVIPGYDPNRRSSFEDDDAD